MEISYLRPNDINNYISSKYVKKYKIVAYLRELGTVKSDKVIKYSHDIAETDDEIKKIIDEIILKASYMKIIIPINEKLILEKFDFVFKYKYDFQSVCFILPLNAINSSKVLSLVKTSRNSMFFDKQHMISSVAYYCNRFDYRLAIDYFPLISISDDTNIERLYHFETSCVEKLNIEQAGILHIVGIDKDGCDRYLYNKVQNQLYIKSNVKLNIKEIDKQTLLQIQCGVDSSGKEKLELSCLGYDEGYPNLEFTEKLNSIFMNESFDLK